MSRPALTADCGNCAALCCVALAFDRGEDFAIDKPAGTPCPNLAGHACSIHARLDATGFAGCVRYDCTGAGQRVTQDLFAGKSWQDDPALLAPMMAAFSDMRAVHRRLELLTAAEALPLAKDDAATRDRLDRALWPDALASETLAGFDHGPMAAEIDAFIASLHRYVPARRG
ncbi:pentapeptide repeat-containing protein [Oceanicola sp. 22II-s10i]|uniref:hypothetical protein n=1 Tax=Oceanicola sp. 22II-s10i TaxID=1317116 RepID=UPI000B52768F|nr:hypothetical protein [Oceanicola sp. 22II-s10i]OWU83423.1 pentapeptide repeat-containing protein [Oceanicola sp. 22II-s10i]